MWRTATKPSHEKPTDSFRGWLLTQTYRIDDVGKVARRVSDDLCLGQRISAESVRQHTLTCHSATPAVLDGFNRAIEEWQQIKGNVAVSQADYSLQRPTARIPVSLSRWAGHAHTWAERGRTWVSLRANSSQFGDMVRRSMAVSRRAGRGGTVRRTPPRLANLLSTSRDRRPGAGDRRIREIDSRVRHARDTGPKGSNEASSANDRWYERVATGK